MEQKSRGYLEVAFNIYIAKNHHHFVRSFQASAVFWLNQSLFKIKHNYITLFQIKPVATVHISALKLFKSNTKAEFVWR
jgi:hypothetical protein